MTIGLPKGISETDGLFVVSEFTVLERFLDLGIEGLSFDMPVAIKVTTILSVYNTVRNWIVYFIYDFRWIS